MNGSTVHYSHRCCEAKYTTFSKGRRVWVKSVSQAHHSWVVLKFQFCGEKGTKAISGGGSELGDGKSSKRFKCDIHAKIWNDLATSNTLRQN